MDQSYSAVESQEGPTKSFVTLEWQDLSYVVTDKVTKQSKTLLRLSGLIVGNNGHVRRWQVYSARLFRRARGRRGWNSQGQRI